MFTSLNNLGAICAPVNVLGSINAINTCSTQNGIGTVHTTSLTVQLDANGEYRITKRLQRACPSCDGTPAQEKREILDLEIVGVQGSAPAITLNGLPISSDQCILGIDGVITVLDVDRHVIDRVQTPVAFAAKAGAPRGMFGFVVTNVPTAVAHAVKVDSSCAALVTAVVPGLAACESGLFVNDIILAVNGVPATAKNVHAIMTSLVAGETLRLSVLRSGTVVSIEMIATPTTQSFNYGNATMAAGSYGIGSMNGLNSLTSLTLAQVAQLVKDWISTAKYPSPWQGQFKGSKSAFAQGSTPEYCHAYSPKFAQPCGNFNGCETL
ncbi:MAG: PDZ domain-containing protein [Phycisphaerales bacterium]|nr:PDZ domain-containing protein [Phycisphaerales bacterium]